MLHASRSVYPNSMKIILPLLSSALTLSALGQTDHFPDIKWKEKETDHFILRSYSTNHDPARKYAKRVWKEMSEILPVIVEDFEKKGFRTPGGDDASKGEQYKYTVYLMADNETFGSVVQTDEQRNGWSKDRTNLVTKVGNYRDPQNRYLVICKTDTQGSGGGNEKDKSALFVHATGAQFLSGQARKSQLPFWMSSGMGYYLEHVIFKSCRVHYLDFEKYYESEDGQAETVTGGTLDAQSPWPSAIRKLSKKDKRVSLEGVMNAKIINLSPIQTGYIFALTHFLASDEERVVKYQAFVAALRDGATPDKELLLETYGYASDADFEKDWYEFIESSKFK